MKAIKGIIERCGAKVVYLLPYFPEVDPIELIWSKLKSSLRKTAAQCKQISEGDAKCVHFHTTFRFS